MTKEKLISLNKYVQDLRLRISGTVPAKHANSLLEYREFLVRELQSVSAKLENAKNSASEPGKK